MAGPVDLIAAVGSSAESLHLMAKLIDLDPDGHAVRICDGAALVHGGWPATVRVDMGDVGYVIRPGHSLRLDVSSSAFPEYELHPGTEVAPWYAEEFRLNQQTMIIGGSQGARLVFWTVEGMATA